MYSFVWSPSSKCSHLYVLALLFLPSDVTGSFSKPQNTLTEVLSRSIHIADDTVGPSSSTQCPNKNYVSGLNLLQRAGKYVFVRNRRTITADEERISVTAKVEQTSALQKERISTFQHKIERLNSVSTEQTHPLIQRFLQAWHSLATVTVPRKDAEIGEEGFRLIQKLHSTRDMAQYILKLLQAAGGAVQEFPKLYEVASSYSGERAKLSWNNLWVDLVAREWTPRGASAFFTEAGYRAVAARHDHAEMSTFIRRLVLAAGGRVLREDSLNGFAPYFSGEKAMQNLERMQDELVDKATTDGWVDFGASSDELGVQFLSSDVTFGRVNWSSDAKVRPASGNCENILTTPSLCKMQRRLEAYLVHKWVPENATVLELGSMYGATTCEIARKMNNSGQLVAVEPDRAMWESLEANLRDNNCRAHRVHGAVSSNTLRMMAATNRSKSASKYEIEIVQNFTFDSVERALGRKIDTVLIDCEGCAQDMLDQISPKLRTQINLVILRTDNLGTTDYPWLISYLGACGLKKVEAINDCADGQTNVPALETCSPRINHYAFRRSI